MIEIGRKVLSDADCKHVLSNNSRSGDDNQILISKGIYENLNWNWTNEPQSVSVTIFKENLINALKFVLVYDNESLFHKGKQVTIDNKWYEDQLKIIEIHFNNSKKALYKFNAFLSTQDRHYVKGLTQDSGLNLQEFLIPKYSSLLFKKSEGEIILEINQDQKNLRGFCFGVFKILVKEFGQSFLKANSENVETKIGDFNYTGVLFKKYFGSSKLLGVFDLGEANKIIESASRFRYQKKPVQVLFPNKEVHFSTEFEFTRSNESHILFDNYKRFVEDYSENKYTVIKDEEGNYQLLNKSDEITNQAMRPIQKIFFGPPGTGKSYHIGKKFGENLPRVTFHPELVYQGFIGAYKPSVDKGGITYKFIPEAFIRAYCEAWSSNEPYYFIIEEINRGNCAQIFGDIFQLLDRNKLGYSEYPIICSPDVRDYLEDRLSGMDRLSEYEELTKVNDFSKMTLPNNLNILCTMNTSDQSLFPMDSAFKRRWDWEYIPIDYEDAKGFEIDLKDGKNDINWGTLIKAINISIKMHTQSEDKQLGNRFVSPANGIISKEEFVSKVVFYLWSEIYKDENGSGDSIFYTDSETPITFGDFFKNGNVEPTITRKFIEYNLPAGKDENDENQADSLGNEEDSANKD